MARNKIVFFDETLIDLTGTTATADKILTGYGAYGKDGVWMDGTATSGDELSVQHFYCGDSVPGSSIGSDGDIYILANSGGTKEAYPADFTYEGMNSVSNASKCIGVSAEDGSATANMYSSGSGTTGVVEYSFDLSDIPSAASISEVSCAVKAHEENSSRSTFTLQLYSGTTPKGSKTTVSGTSNSLYTLSAGSWSRSELDGLVLHTEYGYYGGLVAGATLTIAYVMDEVSYEVTLTGSINNWSLTGNGIYKKSSGSWSKVETIALEELLKRGA